MREFDDEELSRAMLQYLGHGQLLLFASRKELVVEFEKRFPRMLTRCDLDLPPNKEWRPIPRSASEKIEKPESIEATE